MVIAAGRAAVTKEMLGTGKHMATLDKAWVAHFTLQAFHHGLGIGGDQFRRFAVTLVSPAPAIVLCNRKRRGEYPVNAGSAHHFSSRRADFFQQGPIVCSAKANVMGKEHRACDVVVPVNRIGPPDHWDGEVAIRVVHTFRVKIIGEL